MKRALSEIMISSGLIIIYLVSIITEFSDNGWNADPIAVSVLLFTIIMLGRFVHLLKQQIVKGELNEKKKEK